jgi:hypothetical protein
VDEQLCVAQPGATAAEEVCNTDVCPETSLYLLQPYGGANFTAGESNVTISWTGGRPDGRIRLTIKTVEDSGSESKWEFGKYGMPLEAPNANTSYVVWVPPVTIRSGHYMIAAISGTDERYRGETSEAILILAPAKTYIMLLPATPLGSWGTTTSLKFETYGTATDGWSDVMDVSLPANTVVSTSINMVYMVRIEEYLYPLLALPPICLPYTAPAL